MNQKLLFSELKNLQLVEGFANQRKKASVWANLPSEKQLPILGNLASTFTKSGYSRDKLTKTHQTLSIHKYYWNSLQLEAKLEWNIA